MERSFLKKDSLVICYLARNIQSRDLMDNEKEADKY